jgi:hypothetical protein
MTEDHKEGVAAFLERAQAAVQRKIGCTPPGSWAKSLKVFSVGGQSPAAARASTGWQEARLLK